MQSLRQRFLLVVLVVTSFGISGCLFGNSLSVSFFAGIVSFSVGDVEIGTCFEDETDPGYQCLNNGIFSTFEFLAPNDFLLRLFLLDPIVVQVPAGADTFVGSYSHTQSNTNGALAITTATSLKIDANRTLTAEPGTQFVLIALPDGAPTSGTFSFNFNFHPPAGATSIDIKPILTGYVQTTDGAEYYPPIMPCVHAMADATALTVPLPVPGDTLTLPTLTADLGCQDEVYDLVPSLIGPFMCYGTKPSRDAAKLPKGIQATVSDALRAGALLDVKKAAGLCNPATVDGAADDDVMTHLESYAVALAKTTPKQPKDTPRTDLHVTNVFHPHGELVLDTKKASRLLVPTSVANVPPAAPNLADVDVDHYRCHDVKISKGDPKFPKGLRAEVVDELAQPKTYDLKKPTRLCLAADRNGTDPTAPAHVDHLMCYQVKPAKLTPKQAKFTKVTNLFVNNAIAAGKLDVVKDTELCVPSTVAPL